LVTAAASVEQSKYVEERHAVSLLQHAGRLARRRPDREAVHLRPPRAIIEVREKPRRCANSPGNGTIS
jgi:hypothetical protein